MDKVTAFEEAYRDAYEEALIFDKDELAVRLEKQAWHLERAVFGNNKIHDRIYAEYKPDLDKRMEEYWAKLDEIRKQAEEKKMKQGGPASCEALNGRSSPFRLPSRGFYKSSLPVGYCSLDAYNTCGERPTGKREGAPAQSQLTSVVVWRNPLYRDNACWSSTAKSGERLAGVFITNIVNEHTSLIPCQPSTAAAPLPAICAEFPERIVTTGGEPFDGSQRKPNGGSRQPEGGAVRWVPPGDREAGNGHLQEATMGRSVDSSLAFGSRFPAIGFALVCWDESGGFSFQYGGAILA